MQSIDLNNIWEHILQEAKKSMPDALYMRVTSSLIPMSIDNHSIHIGVMQSFIKNLIDQQPVISNALQNAITTVLGSHHDMVLFDFNQQDAGTESTMQDTFDDAPVAAPPMPLPPLDDKPYQEEFYTPVYQEPVYIERAPSPVDIPDEPMITPKKVSESVPTLQSDNVPVDLSLSNLNPAYRFDNYVTGNANRIPFGAAQNVAEFPGGDYNPLFIYGPSGLGKTHLMHAIGNAIKENHPHMKVMSITSENFMNIFVETLQRNQGKLFRNTFRNIDVLMIDDIQFLESRESTKTELFNTFNELLNNNKQIVLTSDTMPNDMEQFEDRLRSRFQAGYIATMENPDLETRIAIFKSLLEREYNKNKIIRIDNDSINYVALQFSENVRVLQGAFNKLIGTASIDHRMESIDLEYTKQALAGLVHAEEVNLVNIETIQNFVSSYFNIKKQDLLGKKRKAQFAFPRQIAMYLCRDMINESYPQIAAAFSRDHTTILHAYEKITKEIEKNEETKLMIGEIKQKLTTCG
ncbi:chromosomal replication initiator protein DnaA [Veillonella denticariosi JCM 15641]|uniref:Chromosomal replication initiator protein DnaA n=1 Tax=Veillonella denticariosi JCM 15641 TaxID=1298594 RepID=A0A2S7ZAT6_9FIRM|nr:chromosomal replication initiator protein DnaA [Veillonella denticariosi]PQL20374.1 chromosomal replication initiator protein DnaA [Veillonella denticariosi JCM 15641]